MQTLEQLKTVRDNAPDGATHIDVVGDYVKFIDDEMYHYSFVRGYGWSSDYVSPCELRSLSDINLIIKQREMLGIAWDAIQEAGYEDFCSELRSYIEDDL